MKLHELRKARGITQKQLAEALGVTIRTITNYENGTREPNIATLITLARFFECSIDYLVGATDDPERRIAYPPSNGRRVL